MFRLHDYVPEVYVKESRDFLLILRVFDTLLSGVKYDIDSIVSLLDVMKAQDNTLQLLCTKVGFFPRKDIDAQVLKYIVSAFPFLTKNKGSREGIEAAINTILKAENNPNAVGTPIIEIFNADDNEFRRKYTVYIYTTIDIYNKSALDEILRYVLPIGYDYCLLPYIKPIDTLITHVSLEDTFTMIKTLPKESSAVRTSTSISSIVNSITDDKQGQEYLFKKVFNAIDTTSIVTGKDLSVIVGEDEITTTIEKDTTPLVELDISSQ